MTVNKGSLVSGRVPVTDYANLTSDRHQFLGLSQAEPNLGPGADNTVLVITTNNTRSWSNSLTLTGNVSANYFIGNGSLLTGIFTTISNQTFQGDGSTIAFTLQQTATAVSILVTVNGITQTPDVDYLVITNILTFTTAPAVADVIQVRFLSNNSVSGTYSNADVAAFLPTYTGNITAANLSATGNIQGQYILGNGAALTNVTISVAGNVVGSQANVGIVAGSYNWTFNNTGNLTLPGNTFAVNYANNTPVNVVTKFEGTWTVPTGNSTQSFTVSPSETYYMWVDCNIPNGILVWNATATITNTNVPVVGAQYAWVYNGGGTPIDFTSIPNQFTGTSNTIVRSSTAPSATTNKFDFGINNTSGSAQTVRYGWIQISY